MGTRRRRKTRRPSRIRRVSRKRRIGKGRRVLKGGASISSYLHRMEIVPVIIPFQKVIEVDAIKDYAAGEPLNIADYGAQYTRRMVEFPREINKYEKLFIDEGRVEGCLSIVGLESSKYLLLLQGFIANVKNYDVPDGDLDIMIEELQAAKNK